MPTPGNDTSATQLPPPTQAQTEGIKFVEVLSVEVSSPEVEGKKAIATILVGDKEKEKGKDTGRFVSERKTTSAILELEGQRSFVRTSSQDTSVRVELTKNSLISRSNSYYGQLNIPEDEARGVHDAVMSIEPRISAAFTLGKLFSVSELAQEAKGDVKNSDSEDKGPTHALEIAASFVLKLIDVPLDGPDDIVKTVSDVVKEALDKVTDTQYTRLKEAILERAPSNADSKTIQEWMSLTHESLELILQHYIQKRAVNNTKITDTIAKFEKFEKNPLVQDTNTESAQQCGAIVEEGVPAIDQDAQTRQQTANT